MYGTKLALFSLLFISSTLAEPLPRPTPGPQFDLSDLGNLGNKIASSFPCDIKDTNCISSYVRGVMTSATANPTLISQASGALAAASQFAGSVNGAASTKVNGELGQEDQAATTQDNAGSVKGVTGTSAALAIAVWAMAFIL